MAKSKKKNSKAKIVKIEKNGPRRPKKAIVVSEKPKVGKGKRNRNRGERRGNVANGTASSFAPLAVSAPMMGGKRMVPTFAKNREPLFDIITDADGRMLRSFPINPGLKDTFPWLARLASNFETYQAIKVDAEFVPYDSASTNGNITMAFDFDVFDGTWPSDQGIDINLEAIRTEYKFITDSVWKPVKAVAPAVGLARTRKEPYYVRTNDNLPPKDRWADLGNLYVAVVGAPASTTLGTVFLDYHFKFQLPTGSTKRDADAADFPVQPLNIPFTAGQPISDPTLLDTPSMDPLVVANNPIVATAFPGKYPNEAQAAISAEKPTVVAIVNQFEAGSTSSSIALTEVSGFWSTLADVVDSLGNVVQDSLTATFEEIIPGGLNAIYEVQPPTTGIPPFGLLTRLVSTQNSGLTGNFRLDDLSGIVEVGELAASLLLQRATFRAEKKNAGHFNTCNIVMGAATATSSGMAAATPLGDTPFWYCEDLTQGISRTALVVTITMPPGAYFLHCNLAGTVITNFTITPAGVTEAITTTHSAVNVINAAGTVAMIHHGFTNPIQQSITFTYAVTATTVTSVRFSCLTNGLQHKYFTFVPSHSLVTDFVPRKKGPTCSRNHLVKPKPISKKSLQVKPSFPEPEVCPPSPLSIV